MVSRSSQHQHLLWAANVHSPGCCVAVPVARWYPSFQVTARPPRPAAVCQPNHLLPLLPLSGLHAINFPIPPARPSTTVVGRRARGRMGISYRPASCLARPTEEENPLLACLAEPRRTIFFADNQTQKSPSAPTIPVSNQ